MARGPNLSLYKWAFHLSFCCVQQPCGQWADKTSIVSVALSVLYSLKIEPLLLGVTDFSGARTFLSFLRIPMPKHRDFENQRLLTDRIEDILTETKDFASSDADL